MGGDGSIGARSYKSSDNTCAEELSTQVPYCKWYDGTANNDDNFDINTCWICKKDFYNFNSSLATPTAVCSNDAGYTGCTLISNCVTTLCVTGAGGNSQGCRMCESGYMPSGWDSTNNSGSTS